MSYPADTPPARLPDDALPPVEPPSAGFILQLFVIPGIIVVIIVMVYLMFNWLAQMGDDPAKYVDELSRPSAARWQVAVNLANALRNPRNESLKQDTQLAAKLADLLSKEMHSGRNEEQDIALRVFLCRALGEFRVPQGLPVLLETVQDDSSSEVRRAAIEATALLVSNLRESGAANVAAIKQAPPVLLAASRDQDSLVRSTAAYALGVLGGDEATARLQRLLSDLYPDVRYNAATGLARHGHVGTIQVLAEMLDPDELAGIRIERQEASRGFKRALIVVNALRATSQLAAANPTADLSELEQAIQRLLKAKIEAPVRIKAEEVLGELQDRPATATAAR